MNMKGYSYLQIPQVLGLFRECLRNLINDKLVERNGTKYKLTHAAHDVRHWSEQLGRSLLADAEGCYFPTVCRLNQNVDNLINMFGTYIVFCFLEVSKQNPELKLKLDQYDQNDDRDRIRALGEIDNMTCEAVKNLFDPQQMYRSFLATMKAQPTEEEIKQTIENRFKITGKTMVYLDENGRESKPPSIKDLSFSHAAYEGSTASAYEKTYNTIYDLDPK